MHFIGIILSKQNYSQMYTFNGISERFGNRLDCEFSKINIYIYIYQVEKIQKWVIYHEGPEKVT